MPKSPDMTEEMSKRFKLHVNRRPEKLGSSSLDYLLQLEPKLRELIEKPALTKADLKFLEEKDRDHHLMRLRRLYYWQSAGYALRDWGTARTNESESLRKEFVKADTFVPGEKFADDKTIIQHAQVARILSGHMESDCPPLDDFALKIVGARVGEEEHSELLLALNQHIVVKGELIVFDRIRYNLPPDLIVLTLKREKSQDVDPNLNGSQALFVSMPNEQIGLGNYVPYGVGQGDQISYYRQSIGSIDIVLARI